MLFIFLSEIPTGIIADKYGRKTSILLGGLCSVVSFLIFGLINDYLVFFVAELIGALAATLFSGADKALIYDTLLSVKEEKEGKVILSRHEAAGTIGTVLGLTSGSIIAGSSILLYPQTLPLTMILSAVTSLLAVFVAFTLKEPQRKEKPKEAFLKVGIEGFKYIFKTPKLRVFALNFALISAATFFMFWLYQSLTRMIGLDIEWNGVVGAGFNLFAILLLLNIKRIEKWFGIRRVLFYSALIPGLFFLGLGFTENTLFVLVA
ncbi:MAG: MFS transporter, partial [Candidatus Zixiibacteriota bacterium]